MFSIIGKNFRPDLAKVTKWLEKKSTAEFKLLWCKHIFIYNSELKEPASFLNQ